MTFRPQWRNLWVGNHRVRQVAGTTWRNEMLRGNRLPLGDQESVGSDAQRRVVMEAAPSAPFEMAEPDLLLELLIVALDAPAHLCGIDHPAEGYAHGKGRQPVFGRRVLALRPLDQQPFFRSAFGEIVITMRDTNAHARKARGQRVTSSRLPGRPPARSAITL